MNHLHEDAIRRIAGKAFARIATTGEKMTVALRKHHATPTRRKEGVGPLANLLLEVDAMERAGIDTSSIVDAVLDVQLAARGTVHLCAIAAVAATQPTDAADDEARTAYLTALALGKDARALRVDWRDRAIANVRAVLQALRTPEAA